MIAAAYNGLKIEIPQFEFRKDNKEPKFLEKFPFGKIPAFEGHDGFTLYESTAIAHYVASYKEGTTLLGKNKKEAAEVQQWISFTDTEIGPQLANWVFVLKGFIPYNKQTVSQATERAKALLETLDKVLLNKTFLVGHRVTLADITLVPALRLLFGNVLDPEYRKNIKNVVRYYLTASNQPHFKAVMGEPALCDVAIKYTPPKKEQKEQKEQPKKKEQTKKAAEDDDDEPAPEPKPKSKLDSLPPSKLNLEEWKRVYSNNNTRPDAVKWFWDNYDPEGYSIWRVDYKYNDELSKVFMSSNLIGGFFNRLERARKYAFGSLVVLGEDMANEIAGYFVIRGQDVPEEVTDAADFESYEFKKVDHNDPAVRGDFEDFLAWDGHLRGKKFADGKIFK